MEQQTNHLHTQEKKTADVVLILSDATLTSLSNHKDKDDLNRTHAYHRDRLAEELTETETELLFVLSKYSLKFCGVSYMSNATMAKAIGRTERTVQRIIAKLKRLGAIEVFETRRRRGDKRQTANIIRFVRMPDEEPDVGADVGVYVAPNNPLPNPSNPVNMTTFESAGARASEEPDTLEKMLAQVTAELEANPPKPEIPRPHPVELAESYGIPESVVRAMNPLPIGQAKFVELFRNEGDAVRDMLFKHMPDHLFVDYVFCFDLECDMTLRVLRSAAVRTAFMARSTRVGNLVGYFLKTFCDLYEKEAELIEEDIRLNGWIFGQTS